MKTFIFIASAVGITLLVALVIAIVPMPMPVFGCYSSKVTDPCYRTGTHLIILKIKIEDSDCFDEVYARATPQGYNHVVLNKQTYKNNDAPDAGPSNDRVTFKWKFSGEKVVQTSKDSIRVYAQLELLDGSTKTITKYKHDFNINTKNYDFGYFHLHAPPTQCLNK